MIKIYKGYQVKPYNDSPMQYVIVTDGKGGKIPKLMEGVYTSVSRAIQQIDTYLETKGKE